MKNSKRKDPRRYALFVWTVVTESRDNDGRFHPLNSEYKRLDERTFTSYENAVNAYKPRLRALASYGAQFKFRRVAA